MPYLSYAEEVGLEKQLGVIYRNAEQAIKGGDIPVSDFWLARYMGLTAFNKETQHDMSDLFPLLDSRKDLKATAFISGRYHRDFIDFFFYAPQGLWGVADDGINEKKREFIVRSDSGEGHFAELVMVPRLEKWICIKEKKNSVAVVPLGNRPFISAGKLKNDAPETFFTEIPLAVDDFNVQYAWPIEFHDLDGDGIPEIWVRYNLAWADGFSQELAIYKIKEGKELVLQKKFSGQAEGIARRLEGNKVEVGHGFTNKDATGHLGYDQTHLEVWEYRKNDFLKTSERDVPHILWTPEWQKYYFDEEEKTGSINV